MTIRSALFFGIILCTGSAFADQLSLRDAPASAPFDQPPFTEQSTLISLHSLAPHPLTLEQAVALAVKHAPQVQAGQYKQEAAAHDTDRAGRWPDPQLQFGVQNLDAQGPGAFNPNADSMTMRFVGISQDIPSLAARAAQRAKASANQDVAEADTVDAQFLAKRNAATAWVNLWAALRADALLARLGAQNKIAIDTAQAHLAGATGTVTDVLAARAVSIELDNQLEAIHGDEQEAYAGLARWVGVNTDQAPLATPPDFAQLPVAENQLLGMPDRQAPLLVWAPRISAAEAALQSAEASKQPDWNVGFSYGVRAPGLPALTSLQVGMRLPLFADHRENQDIDARSADLAAVRAEHEDARRAQIETVARSLARWRSLNAQTTRDELSLLPVAHDRATTALASYRGGGSLDPWLDARRAEINANLAYANLLAARALAWVELAYLMPENTQ